MTPLALARRLARLAFRYEPLRSWRIRRFGGRRPHPVDRQYGIRTGGAIGADLLYGSAVQDRNYYVGSQAGVVRCAFALVRDRSDTVLVDLGCGKGRVLALATEFGFREIIGVELAAPVAEIAEQNMAIVRRRFPDRAPIRVVSGDAGAFAFPDAPLAVFLFNPFGEQTMRRVAARLEAMLASGPHAVTVVYYNPIHGAVFDGSAAFVRAHALEVPYDDYDRGSNPALSSSAVVIWEDARHARMAAPDAQRAILVRDVVHAYLAPAAEVRTAPP